MNIIVDMWSNEDEGALSKWFVNDGDMVCEGDLVATVALEKTEFEVIAQTSGRISVLVKEDGVVRAGETIARID